jgi:signal transduction histidine kinase/PAS domain-containing protein
MSKPKKSASVALATSRSAGLPAVRDRGSSPTAAPHFEIAASVVYQLGEHLISDALQALIELIKNAYDADASYVTVTIRTDAPPPEGSAFPDSLGYVLIEDDGHGMTRETIENGWLVISHSAKRDMKSRGETTKRGRTPLGDKGLGRLGVQRLGDNIEITTRYAPRDGEDEERGDSRAKSAPSPEYVLRYSWGDFRAASRLSQVEVTLEEHPTPSMERGTRLLITNLRDRESWTDSDAVARLRTGLSQLISPYERMQSFRVVVLLNGIAIDLAQISDAVRHTSQVRYGLTYDGKRLSITGRARLTFFRPPSGAARRRFRDEVEHDEGKQFLQYLQGQPAAKSFELRSLRKDGWFVEYSRLLTLETLDKVVRAANGHATDPGPFHGEVDGFNLGAEAAREALETVRAILGREAAEASADDEDTRPATQVFATTKDLNDFIKDLSGVRVYRDGFGVRVDYDWLGLASERTAGKSYYSLRPSNVLGYIGISAKNNAQLVEKTDREGFQRTPEYENFRLLTGSFVTFANEAHDFLRRAWIAFDKQFDAPDQGIARATPKQVAAQISDTLRDAESYRAPLQQVAKALSTDVKSAKDSLRAVLASDRKTQSAAAQQAVRRLGVTVDALAARVEEAREAMEHLDRYLVSVASVDPLSKVLANEIAGLQDRLEDVYAMIGLGLTAEALSHELTHVTGQIAERTRTAIARIRRVKPLDPQLLAYAEFIQSSVAAIRRQLSHLAPSLKYVRERRERLSISEVLKDITEYHRERQLGAGPGEVAIQLRTQTDFMFEMNRGKATQVFDNLILNSEYWLKEEYRAKRLAKPRIDIDVKRPFVTVSDNGRGVDPTVEHRLFTPFVTAKRAGEGRGLGLFISRQLFEADGCAIRLLPERNAKGNLFKFELDFTGALKNA